MVTLPAMVLPAIEEAADSDQALSSAFRAISCRLSCALRHQNLIGKNLPTDDVASRDDVLNYDEDFDKMDSLLIDERDRVLIGKI